jgi:excisionase family DNA binding protein
MARASSMASEQNCEHAANRSSERGHWPDIRSMGVVRGVAAERPCRGGGFLRGVARGFARPERMRLDSATNPVPRLLTVEQVAELCQVSTKTVYRAIRSGALAACRLGKGAAYRVKPEEMERWLDASSAARPAAGDSSAALMPVRLDAHPQRRRSSSRSTSDGRLHAARPGGAQ